MNYLWELAKQILRDMSHNKLRSLLAMFGIFWGTTTVILLLALGESYYHTNKSKIMDVADNSLVFIPGMTSKPYHGRPPQQHVQIKFSEVEILRNIFPEIRWISAILQSSQKTILSAGPQQIDANIEGVNVDFGSIQKQQSQSGGRFLNPLDIKLQRNTIFIDENIQKKLFAHSAALGKEISLNGIPFKVIGIAKSERKGAIFSQNIAYIPYSTLIKLWGDLNSSYFLITLWNPNQAKDMQYKITHYLSIKYNFDSKDKSALTSYDLSQFTQFFHWFFRAVEIFLAFCGTMTLCIGGIGVSNMMYLIVTERTQEIGLRMALGAKNHHIFIQFLLEASVIVLLGSLMGLIFSLFILQILQHATLPAWLGTPNFSITIFLLILFILLLVAWVAGYFPAKRAAELTPVQALAFSL